MKQTAVEFAKELQEQIQYGASVSDIIQLLDENSKIKTFEDAEGKFCTKCKLYKPISAFYNRSAAKDGKNPQCKACSSEKVKDYFIKKKNDIKSNSSAASRKSFSSLYIH